MRYSLESDLMPIIEGKVALPNFEAKSVAQVINNVAALGHGLLPKWGYARRANGGKDWAQFFLTPAGMGSVHSGCFDGGGYVMIYNPRYEGEPIIGTFAICRHEKKPAAGANPSRGWHPGSCAKCGLNMTIDSGD